MKYSIRDAEILPNGKGVVDKSIYYFGTPEYIKIYGPCKIIIDYKNMELYILLGMETNKINMEKAIKNPLEIEYLKNTCKIGQGNSCCRYVVASSKGIECAKHTDLKTILDQRVANNQMVARGDNCEGVK